MSAQKKKAHLRVIARTTSYGFKGNYNMGEKYGECIENGEATTYPPC